MTMEVDLTETPKPSRPSIRFARVAPLLAGSLALAVLTVGASFGLEHLRIWMAPDAILGSGTAPVTGEAVAGQNPQRAQGWSHEIYSSLDRPPTVAAHETWLDDDEEVLGVVVEGHARAYRLRALQSPENHVVNDLIGNQPVSVTYCPVSQCTRAFTDPTSDAPLDITVGGLYRPSGLVLRVQGKYYEQINGRPFDEINGAPDDDRSESQKADWPLVSFPVSRTTWADWQTQHPRTDVYEGDRPPPSGPSRAWNPNTPFSSSSAAQ